MFKTKLDQQGRVARYKARLVAQGFSQVPGRDFLETYAPVARPSSIRTMMAMATEQDWHLDQMDVDTAYLYAPVEEEIYMRQPVGKEQLGPNGEQLVCRLKKSLYGLKQSGRNWNQVIGSWLTEYGLTASDADPCVYTQHSGSSSASGSTRPYINLVVALYVDDLLITGQDRGEVDRFKNAISQAFKMKDLGAVSFLLGMEVVRDRAVRTLQIKRTAYVKQVLQRFGMDGCKPVSTPAESAQSKSAQHGASEGVSQEPSKQRAGGQDTEYMALVGSTLYAATMTRPDISFAVQSLSRHLQKPGPEHWAAGKRVLRYLQGTAELGITYSGGSSGAVTGIQLVGYCDADWGGDSDSRRSTTAYVFQVSGGSVSWASKLQHTVALSSAEAEYMAASAAVQEAVYLRQLLFDLGQPQHMATVLFEDNQGCIAMAANPVLHKRSKHIDIRYHFVRERVASGEIELRYIPTQQQQADLLTKALSKERVESLRAGVLGHGAVS